jgi:DNA-binding transcriptional ArsR family regulator
MSRDLSVIGHALSAPVRSRILTLLMDGSTRPASELASSAGVRASTASEHLAVLLDAGLISCHPRGRQRFYAIADSAVASALEQLGHLSPAAPPATHTQSSAGRDLTRARLCYDHLAGRLGVALTEAMVVSGWVDADATTLTPAGVDHLVLQGIDVAELRTRRRPLVRPCPDWTERRPHLAGSVGAAIATDLLRRRWVVRHAAGRGLRITAEGAAGLPTAWNMEVALVAPRR